MVRKFLSFLSEWKERTNFPGSVPFLRFLTYKASGFFCLAPIHPCTHGSQTRATFHFFPSLLASSVSIMATRNILSLCILTTLFTPFLTQAANYKGGDKVKQSSKVFVLCSNDNLKQCVDLQVPLYVNKVGPYFNPQETYHYYSLPVCRPDKVNVFVFYSLYIRGKEELDFFSPDIF